MPIAEIVHDSGVGNMHETEDEQDQQHTGDEREGGPDILNIARDARCG